MTLPVLLLAFVTLERLFVLWFARRNTQRLLARGAVEAGRGHYPWLVALHVLWLASLWWFGPGQPVDVFWLGMFVLLTVARIWVIATLGLRWTTRIIVLSDEPLVRSGPYRWLAHPNYLVVIGEIAVLPLVFGLWEIALIFTIANLALLAIRVREENRALTPARDRAQRQQPTP